MRYASHVKWRQVRKYLLYVPVALAKLVASFLVEVRDIALYLAAETDHLFEHLFQPRVRLPFVLLQGLKVVGFAPVYGPRVRLMGLQSCVDAA